MLHCCRNCVPSDRAAVNPDPEGRERGEERPSPYADGMFELQVDFSPSYPMVPPKIKFLTPVYHPNVRKEGAEMGQVRGG